MLTFPVASYHTMITWLQNERALILELPNGKYPIVGFCSGIKDQAPRIIVVKNGKEMMLRLDIEL